jgi:hypothetical protein
MTSHPQEATKPQVIGYTVFGLALAFCGGEMVPGWGLFRLGWPPEVYYAIMALVCRQSSMDG